MTVMKITFKSRDPIYVLDDPECSILYRLGYKNILLSVPKEEEPCAVIKTEDISTVVKANVEDEAATLYFFDAY